MVQLLPALCSDSQELTVLNISLCTVGLYFGVLIHFLGSKQARQKNMAFFYTDLI